MFIALATKYRWSLHQLDVKSTFLNGELKEEVYLTQPEGFIKKGQGHFGFKLKKALYGLKQAPREWCSKIDGYLQSLGFTKSEVDPNLYILQVGKDPLILVLYVDDLFLTGAKKLITWYKKELDSQFKINIELMHYFLGLEVWQHP